MGARFTTRRAKRSRSMKPPETDRIHRALNGVAQVLALTGGAVLLLLVVLVCVSAVGNAVLNLGRAEWLVRIAPDLSRRVVGSGVGPLKAGYELIEIGLAIAVFAFLPWAGMRGAHARVDIATTRLPARVCRMLDRLWLALLALVFAIVAWRMGGGLLGKLQARDTTFLLGIPLWWAYAACLPSAWVAALCAAWGAVRGRAE